MATNVQNKRSRIVELYCPEYESTTEHFMITPSMNYTDIIVSVRAAFRNRHELVDIHLCDINGEPLFDDDECPSSVSAIADGERILIAVNGERIPPEPRLEVVLFLEDDNLQKPLRRLSRETRRNHMRTLRRADALRRRNFLRLTLPHSEVLAALSELEQAKAHQMRTKYSRAASRRIIAGHWHVENISECSEKCLATIAILSGATSGQPLVVQDELVFEMVRRREREGNDDGLQEEDVRAVIRAFYEQAGVLGSKWPETGKVHVGIARHGEKRGAYSKAKMKDSRILHQSEMGEEAAEAADPGAEDVEVNELAGRLGNTVVPDNRMLESDSEEDPVRKPGRLQRM